MLNLIHPFKKIWHFLVAILIFGMIINVVFFSDPQGSLKIFAIQTLWSSCICLTQWIGHAFLQTLIAKKFSWLEYPTMRAILTVISIIGYAIFAFLLVQSIMNYLFFGEWPYELWALEIKQWYAPISIAFIISLFVAASSFFKSWRTSVLEKERIQREMLIYKYEALRNQINPHFMFNSLNVLSDLVYDDQKMAVRFIHHFSDVYRYVLDSREKELVPLVDEVAFIEKYIFLLKIRFEEKLKIEINIAPQENDHIVPLALQLLLENAVKHNEVSKAYPLTVHVEQSNGAITVWNQRQPKNSGENSKKIGLKNLRQQIAFFTDSELNVTQTDQLFKVTVPLISLSS